MKFKNLLIGALLITFTNVYASAVKPIVAVIPFAAGGGADIAFRHFQKYVEKKGVLITPVYKGGAEGLIGMKELETSSVDSTIGFGTVAAVAEHRNKNKSYQFEYISIVKTSVMALVTHPNSKIKTLNELESSVKRNISRSFAYGSPSQKISIDQFLKFNNAVPNIITVPYKGSGPLINDLLGGHVDIALMPMSVVKAHIDNKKLTLLAVSLTKDLSYFNNIPVLNKRYSTWTNTDGFCIMLPQGASSTTVAFWSSLVHSYITDSQIIFDFELEHSESTTFGNVYMKKIVDNIVLTLQ
jgi:tripartite-type tricarboxylate transporter receptor subunit TctC